MPSSDDSLKPGGHTEEEIKAAVKELESLGYIVYKKDTSNKVQCFMCQQWQSDEYTKLIKFNGIEEPVCLGCVSHLNTREDSLESKRLEAEI